MFRSLRHKNAVHCKHISISKAIHKATPKYHPHFFLFFGVSLPCGCSNAHNHVSNTVPLAIYKWIALKCFKRHACDIWCVCLRARTPLFSLLFKCHSCCWRNYGCVWSITKRKCHIGSSQIHARIRLRLICACVHISQKRGQEKAA